MSLKEKLSSWFNLKSPQELLMLYGKPRKIFDLNNHFGDRDLVGEADQLFGKSSLAKKFRIEPQDYLDGYGTHRVFDMINIFHKEIEKVRKKLGKECNASGLSSYSVYIRNSNYDPREYWLGNWIGIGTGQFVTQEDIIAIAQHGEIWWMYVDRDRRYSSMHPDDRQKLKWGLFETWLVIDEKFLSKSAKTYREERESYQKAREEESARRTAQLGTESLVVVVEYIDGTSQRFSGATYRTEGNLIVITSTRDSSVTPIILPVVNIKSIRGSVGPYF